MSVKAVMGQCVMPKEMFFGTAWPHEQCIIGEDTLELVVSPLSQRNNAVQIHMAAMWNKEVLTFHDLNAGMKKENVMIRFCANCGKLYCPSKNNSIYCPDPAPQNPNKTCREIGPQIRRKEKRILDPNEHEHHNTTCRLYNELRRMKEYGIEEDETSEKSFRAQLRRENERYKEAKDIKRE